ncbi:MAG: YraN family protein [Methylococcaceae bacterium]
MPNITKPQAAHLQRGKQAEQFAHDYLLSQGLLTIARNFRCPYGELDLIMREGQTLVIVEVRYRKNNLYGGALESITRTKQQRILTTTAFYLNQYNIDCPIRFDVIAITANNQLQWLQNAFTNDVY